MKTYSFSLLMTSNTNGILNSVRYAKELRMDFLKKYSSECNLRLCEIADIEKGSAITADETEEGIVPVVAGGTGFAYYHNSFNREANIITVSASGANAGYVNYWNVAIWASDCSTIKSKNEDKYSTHFIYYLLKLIQNDIYIFRKGADQPHVYPSDLRNILLPNIAIEKQIALIRQIKIIEENISEQQKNINPIQQIIDGVIQKEFGFDYDTFEKLKKIKTFDAKVADYSNNPDLRFSAKFHRTAGEFVKQELAKITDKKIKHFLSEPIVLGASVSPSDYDENGEVQYLSMATIKTWEYNGEDAQYVSNSYALSKKEKTIRKNDIILARSGEGTIGKVALIEDDEIKAIFADFTMRIRLKNYNPQFAYYFMRSVYFQYLIEIYKKGLGNNTNIFPIVIREFPFPDISLDEQQRIVDGIQIEINKQSQIKNKIADLRKEIDIIVEKSLKEE